MTTHTVPHGFSFPILRIPRIPQHPATLARTPAASATRASWMERLAAWAERQPLHHRIGSYQRFR